MGFPPCHTNTFSGSLDSTYSHKGKTGEVPAKETNPSSQKVDLMSHPGHPIVKPTPRRPNAGKVSMLSERGGHRS